MGLLYPQQHEDNSTNYSFATGTDYALWAGENITGFMILRGAAAPSTAHNNAPLGSLYIDTAAYDLYVMTAAATWTVAGTQS